MGTASAASRSATLASARDSALPRASAQVAGKVCRILRLFHSRTGPRGGGGGGGPVNFSRTGELFLRPPERSVTRETEGRFSGKEIA